MIRIAATLLFLTCLAGTALGQPEPGVVTGATRSADGVPIRYEVRGMGEPTLVLVHGWTNDRSIWGEHPRTLSRTNRVVAIDLAGHGESGADRDEWTMASFGQDVVAVIEHLELGSVVLLGFSMGGPVVLEAAIRMPNQVAGVVLVDAFKDPDAVLPDSLADIIERQFRANWGDTAFLRAFAFTPDAPDTLVQRIAARSPAQPREHWFPILRGTLRWAHTDAKATLARLDVPLAAINTTREPTNVPAFRRYAPDFTVDTVQGVGHAGILLQRVEDFDARVRAILERFASTDRRRN